MASEDAKVTVEAAAVGAARRDAWLQLLDLNSLNAPALLSAQRGSERQPVPDNSKPSSSTSSSPSASIPSARESGLPSSDSPHSTVSCPDCRRHIAELSRVSELWQSAKREVRELNRTQESLLLEYRDELESSTRKQRAAVKAAEEEARQLRSELRRRDEQLEAATEDEQLELQRNRELKQTIATMQKRAEEQAAEHLQALKRLRQLEQEAERGSGRAEPTPDEQSNTLLKEQLRETRRALAECEARVNAQDVTIRQLRLELQAASQAPPREPDVTQELQLAQRRLSAAQARIEDLQSQLRSKQSQLNEHRAELLHSKQSIQLRLEALQDQCERVSELLKVGGGDGSAAAKGGRRRPLPSWLPVPVAQLIREYRDGVPAGGEDERMAAFLIALNRIWKARVEEAGRRARAEREAEVAELRRRLQARLPFELITHKSRLQRLQQELADSRQLYLQRKGAAGAGQQPLLDLALATVEKLSAQLIEAEAQQERLRQRLTQAATLMTDAVWANAIRYADRLGLAAEDEQGSSRPQRLAEERDLFLEALEENLRQCRSDIEAEAAAGQDEHRRQREAAAAASVDLAGQQRDDV